MRRRTFLAVTGVGLAPALAGCFGDDGSDSDNDVNETADSDDDTTDENNEDNMNELDGQLLFEDSFSATSQGGFLAINKPVDGRSAAREAGFVLPDGEQALTLEAEVAEDGSWESTQIEFPNLQTEISGFSVEAELDFADGLSGTLTDQRMTANGTVTVVITDPIEGEFSFEITATSEQSGSLTGETNFAEEPFQATLVDNEFTIEEGSGGPLIDNTLGLPADEPGTNWFELEIELAD
jgi:hypothetical protein